MTSRLFAATCFAALLVVAHLLCAQEIEWQNPLPDGYRKLYLQFPSPECGYTVANDELRRTTDYGYTWTVVGPMPGASASAMHFADCDQGWCSVRRYVDSLEDVHTEIWQTMNGGASWSRANSPEPELDRLTHLKFFPGGEGWAVGWDSDSAGTYSLIWRTTDGAQTWYRQYMSEESPGEPVEFEMHPSGVGWLLEYRQILRTTDRGNSWSVVLPPADFGSLYAMSIVGDSLGWVIDGHGEVMRSTNGGLDWFTIATDVGTDAPAGIRFLNSRIGFATSYDYAAGSRFLRTTDGGETWRPQETGRDYYPIIVSIAYAGEYRMFATGERGYQIRSENAGQTWTQVGTSVSYSDITAIDHDGVRGYAVTNMGEILRTTNGGQTWLLNLPMQYRYLEDVQVFGSQAYACGHGIFLRTTSGGADWDTLTLNDNIEFEDLSFLDRNHGWRLSWLNSAEDSMIVEKTNDGGTNWTIQHRVVRRNSAWRHIDMVGSYVGFIYGYSLDDSLLKTTDGGNTWVARPAPEGIRCLDAVTESTIWAATDEGVIVSRDGGAQWADVAAPPMLCERVDFYDEQNGIFSGWYADFMLTTDGGASWIEYRDGESFGEQPVVMTESGKVVVAGRHGAIFGYEAPGGSMNVTPPFVPNSMALSVYPNPFNPAASLKFELAASQHVKLAIYDLNGRLVETLADEIMQPGAHSLTWNADRFSSGIYFARLVTGTQSVTSKLVLLR